MLYSRGYTAEGAIPKFRIVKFGTTDTAVTLATLATDRIVGVYVGPDDAVDTQAVEVILLGECLMEITGAIGRGMSLTTNASGQGINAAPAAGANTRIVAIALISGTNANIPVFVAPSWYQG